MNYLHGRGDHATIGACLVLVSIYAGGVQAASVARPAAGWEEQAKRFLMGLDSEFRTHQPELGYVNRTVKLLELPEPTPYDRCDFSAVTTPNIPETDHSVESIAMRYAYDSVLARRSQAYKLGQGAGEAIDTVFRSLIDLEVEFRQCELRGLAAKGLAFENVVVTLFIRHCLAQGVRKSMLLLEGRDPRFQILINIYCTPIQNQ